MKNGVLILALMVFYLIVFYSCSEKPIQGSTFFNFDFEGQSYRIRSVSVENNGYSYNELVGKKFVANDFDQDGIIDKILYGEINIADAQKIYEHALSILTKQDKLLAVKPIYHCYRLTNSDYDYEIKSFQPKNVEPFNQFKVVEKEISMQPGFIMGIDQMADGIIDTVVVGSMSLENIQALYINVLESGLQNKQIIKSGNMILVK